MTHEKLKGNYESKVAFSTRLTLLHWSYTLPPPTFRCFNDFDATQDAIHDTTFQHQRVFENWLLHGHDCNKDGKIFAIQIVLRC